jgi:hypothetical protein
MLERIFGTNGLEKIISREIDLTTQKRAAVAALAVAREAAGRALVEGEAGQELASVTRLVEEISAASRAISLIRARRAHAITVENVTAANRLRSQAADAQREMNTLNTKVGKLLADLGKIEGVEFDQAGIFVAANGPSRSDTLSAQIRDLNAKADTLESGAVPKNGCFDGDAITDEATVIAGVLRHHSEGPLAEAVADWLSACADNVRVPGRSFGNLPRRVRMEWTGSVIDTAVSYVFVPGLTRKAVGRTMTNGSVNPGESEFFDLPTGEFRAAA